MASARISRIVEQQPQRLIKHIQKPRRLRGREAPNAGEGLRDLRGDHGAPVELDALQRVPADRVREVGRV
jgi:hypothetical protein